MAIFGRGCARSVLFALLIHFLTGQIAASPPPFSLVENSNRWSLFTPAKKPFFSLGVDMVVPGVLRADFDPENPAYGFWQAHADEKSWADQTLKRLADWRFTTIAAWSDTNFLRASPKMLPAFTPVLHLGASVGIPWWDMWDAKNVERLDQLAAAQIVPIRDDPRLLGYYTDNEMGWWNATLFHMALEQSAASGQRQRLLKLLREHYANDWTALTADFETDFASSWADLEQRGQLFLRPGSNGIHVMREFLSLCASRYYQLVHDVIRKYDQRALILGDRYQSFYYPEVARAAAPWVDAISSNLNANWNDGSFVRCYLDTLYAVTHKPIFVSEFYLAAMQNRTGNKNNHGVFPRVETQAERARAAANTLRMLAELPYVVGADWFQYFDEPARGREDGENYNFGLVDIQDRPYEELTRAIASLDLDRIHAKAAKPRADASLGIPRAPFNPFADVSDREILRGWDRERGFVKPANPFPLADLYVCWDREALYLGLHCYEIVEEAYYRNASIPKIDRALWSVITGGPPIQARIGAEREALVNDSAVRVENQSGINLNVHNIAIMKIPSSRFGKKRFGRGDKIELNATLLTHARGYTNQWQGSFVLK